MNKLFLDILKVQSASYETERMAEFIFDHCIAMGYEIDIDNDNLYVTKGFSPDGYYPCIVSHTDTVHAIIPDSDYKVIYDDKIAMAYNSKTMKTTGVGGDDKVGIYICLTMLQELDYCKAAFFRDEEVGCVGSQRALMSFFKDCRFVLQCDRKGNKDFVYSIMGTQLYGDNFFNDVIPIISDYGYSESIGGLTDVYTLKELGVGLAVANMSCGYYNPHMDDEIINLDDVENTLNMVFDIMSNCTKVYTHEYVKPVYKQYTAPAYKGGYGYPKSDYGDWYGNTPVYKKTDDKKDVNDDKWSGWSYNNGKYSKTYGNSYPKDLFDIEQKYECWSCYNEFNKEELNQYSLCEHCNAWHYGVAH